MSDFDFPSPVIILGSPRSFTSLVGAMLGQHPETYGVPELNLFITEQVEELIGSLTGYRQIQLHGVLRAAAQLYTGEQTLLSVDMARSWLMRRINASTTDIYYELCRKVAPLRIVDKSPVYSLSLENLQRVHAAFPDAHLLHLVRNPRTQGESMMKIAKGAMAILNNSIDYTTDPPTVDPQIAWFDVQSNIAEFLADTPPANKLVLRGEDVLDDPLTSLAKVCRWLAIGHTDECIEAMMHPEDSPFARLGPVGAHLGNDINFLRSPAFRPGRVKNPALAGPLPWRGDERGLTEEVLQMARGLGYE